MQFLASLRECRASSLVVLVQSLVKLTPKLSSLLIRFHVFALESHFNQLTLSELRYYYCSTKVLLTDFNSYSLINHRDGKIREFHYESIITISCCVELRISSLYSIWATIDADESKGCALPLTHHWNTNMVYLNLEIVY